MSLPRGIRNNNPLNIRRSRAKWQGMNIPFHHALRLEYVPKIEKSKQNRKISGILFGGFGRKVYFCSRN